MIVLNIRLSTDFEEAKSYLINLFKNMLSLWIEFLLYLESA